MLFNVVAGIGRGVGCLIVLVAGHPLLRASTLSVGTVFLLVQYTNLVARPIRHLMRQVSDLQNISACVQCVSSLLFHPQPGYRAAGCTRPATQLLVYRKA